MLEHISKSKENLFLQNILFSLKKNGALIVGMPSLESQKYASKSSKISHINCKTKKKLKRFLLNYFHNCFDFSMNDEVIHFGFDSMSHYILVFAINKRHIIS